MVCMLALLMPRGAQGQCYLHACICVCTDAVMWWIFVPQWEAWWDHAYPRGPGEPRMSASSHQTKGLTFWQQLHHFGYRVHSEAGRVSPDLIWLGLEEGELDEMAITQAGHLRMTLSSPDCRCSERWVFAMCVCTCMCMCGNQYASNFCAIVFGKSFVLKVCLFH